MCKLPAPPVEPPPGYFWYVSPVNVSRYEMPPFRYHVGLYPEGATIATEAGLFRFREKPAEVWSQLDGNSFEFATTSWDVKAASKRLMRRRKHARRGAIYKAAVLGRHPR